MKHTRSPSGRPMGSRRRPTKKGYWASGARERALYAKFGGHFSGRAPQLSPLDGTKTEISPSFRSAQTNVIDAVAPPHAGQFPLVIISSWACGVTLCSVSRATPQKAPSARPCNAWRSSCPQCGRSSFQRTGLAYHWACYANMPPTVWTAASAIVHCRSYAPHRTVLNIRNKKKGDHRTQTLEATVHAVL